MNEIWDDTPVQASVGDDFHETVLGVITTVITAAFLIMAVVL